MKDVSGIAVWKELKEELFLYRSKAIEDTPPVFGLRLYRQDTSIVVTYCLNIKEGQLHFSSESLNGAILRAINCVKKRNNKGEN
jgi:hypothetical protein